MLRLRTSALGVAAGVVLGTGGLVAPGSAQEADARPVGERVVYDVVATDDVIRVDGRLDEPAWSAAARLPLAYEVDPGNNTPAAVDTDCFVTYTRTALYLGCVASDPDPSGIRAYVTDRDDMEEHDQVGFTIDPFNDARRAFEFGISALGVQTDRVIAQESRDGTIDRSWDAIWRSAGRITGDGYVVEAAIPFRSLRFPNASGVQTWGMYAWRIRPRSERVEYRSMRLDRGNSCELCQANLVRGFAGMSPGLNLELVPTLTSSRTDERADIPSPLESGDVDPEPGLDVRWGITTGLTANATVNPDFSQVEADVAQLDVNNRFALFFPEKRPFFLEGADLFNTPLRAVFTRTIVDPTFGTKMTGKSGANAGGVILARDRRNNLVFPSNQGSSATTVDEGVTTLVARYRRDVGSSSTIGGMVVGREGGGYHNRIAGIDGFFRPWNPVTVEVQYLRADTRYPAAVATAAGQPTTAFTGEAGWARVRYDTRRWLAQGSFRSLSPGFRADAGFENQVDLREYNFWFQRKYWGRRGGWFSQLRLNGGAWRTENLAGRLTEEGVWANVYYEGPLQTHFWVNPDRTREYFNGTVFALTRVWSEWGVRPSGNLGVTFQANLGDAVDLANTRKAFRVEFAPSLDLRVGRHLDVRLSHRRQRLSLRGAEIFTARLSQMRTVYSFTPRAFVRAVVQHRSTTRNPDLHAADVNRDENAVFGQFLFSYKVNPQTVFFLGYADNRLGSTDEAFQTIPLTQTSRTFFMKLGYAWRP